MRLYYHKTDGGAEYLCSSPVEGTDEGSLHSQYIVRIDGDITKDAELQVGEPPDEPVESDRPDSVLPLLDSREAASLFSLRSHRFDTLAKQHNVPRFRPLRSGPWLYRRDHLELLARKLIPDPA